MTFSTNEQAVIRRAFETVLAGLGPSRDLGDLLSDPRVMRAATARSAPVRGAFVALGIAAAVVVGVGVMLFLGVGDSPKPGEVGSSLGPEVSVPIVSVPAPTSITTTTTTEQDQQESRRATAELMACMTGTWDFDLAAYQAELQNSLNPEGDVVVVSVDSGSGLLVIGPEMRFTLTYTDLVIRFEFPGGIGPITNELRVNGEVHSTFRLDGTVFLPGPIDDPFLAFYRTIAGQPGVTIPELPPAIRDASLRLGTPGTTPASPEMISLECGGTRLVVNDRMLIGTFAGDGPSAIWIRRQG